MAKVSYYLRPSKRKEHSFINIRYSYGKSKNFRKSTGIEILTISWDAKKQNLRDIAKVSKYRTKVNNRLQEIENFFDAQKGNDENKLQRDFNIFLIGNDLKEKNFADFVHYYIKEIAPKEINRASKKPLTARTIKSYNSTYFHLKNFKEKTSEIDMDFHSKILAYFNKKNLAANTVGGYIKNIKKFVKEAAKYGYKVNPIVFTEDFYKPSEESKSIYLNEAEIKALFDYDFSDNKRYENVRDWLIIGCWLGLRVSDWNRVNNIDDDLIKIKPLKTMHTSGKEVVIPLHPMIKEIIKVRGWAKKISDVEFNRTIKKVCQIAGIDKKVYGSYRENKMLNVGYHEKWKMISSHTARRSFATNLYKSNFPTISIMALTGHSTEKSFLKYIKVTPTEHAEKLRKHWQIK